MEILTIASFVVGVWTLLAKRVHTQPSSTFTRKAAYEILQSFREEWDLARVRKKRVELAILMERGYIAMRRYESEMRTMRVLKSRSATSEIRELGNMCRKIANRIASNQVSVEDWPALSGAIGQQLGATMLALKPPKKR